MPALGKFHVKAAATGTLLKFFHPGISTNRGRTETSPNMVERSMSAGPQRGRDLRKTAKFLLTTPRFDAGIDCVDSQGA